MERVLAIVGAFALAALVLGGAGFGIVVILANAMSDAGRD